MSLELSQRKVDHAQAQLARAGLADFVEFRIGSALDTLPRLAGPFDLVLLDLWKDLYVPCLELFHPKLSPGALVAADNMLFPLNTRPAAAAYQARVRTKPDLDSVLLPIGSGVELSRKHEARDVRKDRPRPLLPVDQLRNEPRLDDRKVSRARRSSAERSSASLTNFSGAYPCVCVEPDAEETSI